jgi:RNA polymerase sigma-70 factor (ECF subfamily)
MSNDSAATDAQLVARARLGDAAAFDALVRRYLRVAYPLAFAITHDHHATEDACQDACVRMLDHLHECRSPARFAGWFFTIVRSAAQNLRRREHVRRAESLDTIEVSNRDSPARDTERAELRHRLGAALGALERTECDVVLLHDLEGWTHRAIGDALGISEVNSRQLLFVARRKLREALGDLYPQQTTHD